MGKNPVVTENSPYRDAYEILAFCSALTASERHNFLMFLQGVRLAKTLTDISKDKAASVV